MSDILSLQTGLSSSCYPQLSETVFANYQKGGVPMMEISMHADQYAYIPWDKLPQWSEQYGVGFWSIHLPFSDQVNIAHKDPAMRVRALSTHTALLEKAAALGIRIAVVHPSAEPIDDADREAAMTAACDSLRVLAEEGERFGITIAVENLPRTCLGNCSEDMVRLLAADPRLRVCFDTNHLLKETHDAFLDRVGEAIVTLHVSDYDFVDERHQLPGEGQIDWPHLVARLEALDYQGVFMYEVGFTSEPGRLYGRQFGPLLCEADFPKNHAAIKTL